jgi:large repetitive protein
MRFARMLILVAAVAAVLAPAALALRFTDASFNTPVGLVGQPYSHQFEGAAGCGPGLPYQYRILNGSLPPGLSLSTSGLISGTPTSAGTWTFWVELSDQDPPSASWCVIPAKAEREFKISILANLAITTPSTPPGVVGRGYSLGLQADGGGTQSWSIASGQLPPGLALAGSTLSGTPTTAGTYTFVVKVSDPTPRAATKSFTLVVRDLLKVTAPPTPSPSEVGALFKPLTFAATGGSGSNTWTVTGLPAGLTFNTTTLAIEGTPTAAGTFPVKVSVGDNEGQTATLDVPLTVAAHVNIATTRFAVAKAGKLFRGQLKVVGGVGPNTFKVVKGSGKFPAGVRLDPTTGVVSGIPKKAGVYRLTFEVTDSLGVKDTQTLVINVLPAPKKH